VSELIQTAVIGHVFLVTFVAMIVSLFAQWGRPEDGAC